MAIDFTYDPETDLAIYSLTGKITTEDWVLASERGTFRPARNAVVDLRHCDLGSIVSMDLHKLTRYLQSDQVKGQMIPGKTAIIANSEGPLIYHPTHRLFHSFTNFIKDKKLPRQFRLFTSPLEALDWLGDPPRESKYARKLLAPPP